MVLTGETGESGIDRGPNLVWGGTVMTLMTNSRRQYEKHRGVSG